MTRRPAVVCVGVATLDAIVEVDRLPGPDDRVPATDGRLAGGGVAATAAVTLARLSVPVAMIGLVGDDAAGRWIRDDLEAAGVDVTGLRMVAGRSPLSVVLVERGSGGRSLAPFAGGLGSILLDASDLERCGAARWVHVDHAGIETLTSLGAAGVRTEVSFDGGVTVPDVNLRAIDLYAPTEAALKSRYPGRDLEAAMAAAHAEGPAAVIVTRGAAGSTALLRDPAGGQPTRHDEPAFPIAAGGSTLGAGDVYHGALLAALVEGRSIADALQRANACAALACRAIDGRSAIPTAQELEEYIVAQVGRSADAGA